MDPQQLADQIDRAMRSRVAIEQAKGILAVQGNINMDAAYSLMTRYGQQHRIFISEIATQVLNRTMTAADLLGELDELP